MPRYGVKPKQLPIFDAKSTRGGPNKILKKNYSWKKKLTKKFTKEDRA